MTLARMEELLKPLAKTSKFNHCQAYNLGNASKGGSLNTSRGVIGGGGVGAASTKVYAVPSRLGSGGDPKAATRS